MRQYSIRAGIIGAGFIGPVHLEALRRIGVQVTALCDQPDRVEAVAHAWGVPECYHDYRALLRSPNLDVVHIAAPNRLHFEMALAALEAGKHCVCEKPLALNTQQTTRIVKLARTRRTVFAVNYNVRFYPAVLRLHHLVQQGDLGEIIHVNGSYLQDWLLEPTDYNWRLLPGEGGRLRAVADIGTHWMDTVSFILGARIQAAFSDLVTFHKTRQRPLGDVRTFSKSASRQRFVSYRVKTEDFANVLLEFAGGVRGSLSVSQVAAGRKNCIRLEIYGAKKSAAWNSEEPETIWFGNRSTANEVAVRNTPAFAPGAAGFMDYPAGHLEGFPDTFKMLFRAVYDEIAGRKVRPRLFATAEDGHREVAVCEAILRSHQTGKWVRV